MIGLFKFLLNRDDNLEGTVVLAKIKEVTGGDKPYIYKPRSGKLNGSI